MATEREAGNAADSDPNPQTAGVQHAWVVADIQRGLRMAVPLMPGMIAIGLAVGTAASSKGLTFLQNIMMNVLVFAGASQLVAFEVWPRHFTIGSILGVAIIVAIVNARILLITASLQPLLGNIPTWQVYPLLHLATDPAWLITMRAEREGRAVASVFLGASVALLIVWLSMTVLGFWLGESVGDPRRFGLDLVVPIFFTAMLVPLWKGARRAVPWATAGAVAVAVQQLLGGWYFVAAGAVAGMLVGAFSNDD